MKLINQYTLTVKKSKFIAYYYEIDNELEVNDILLDLKKNNRKAKHFPYAYKIDNIVRKSDDKEPANTAGSPILNIIEKKELNHVLIVIIRYFGGIKLGTGGLIRSYGSCAKNVLEKGLN